MDILLVKVGLILKKMYCLLALAHALKSSQTDDKSFLSNLDHLTATYFGIRDLCTILGTVVT